jgi:radical SAM superfamily enzyme YgiQ (UPF0313 family)
MLCRSPSSACRQFRLRGNDIGSARFQNLPASLKQGDNDVMTSIVLATINARYVHAAVGLRYLKANMGALFDVTEIVEFVLGVRPIDIVEAILKRAPRIVGLGVYIWNIEEMTKVAALLKRVAPEVIVVLGGPEVSYETDQQAIIAQADYVITGWGDVSFAMLCHDLIAGNASREKVIAGEQPPLDEIKLPYTLYTDEDVAKRFIYVEASRGCPFKCEFCLSALDKTAWPFDDDEVLGQLDELYQRGARHFRFVDRTFNLKIATSIKILEFFLARLDDKLFVHFEVIPDHLPDALKAVIKKFPPERLQFEIGIQTWNPQVQSLISRRQDNDKSAANIAWLRNESAAHLHVDLIAGLPGEDIESFGSGFDRLVALNPHDIQVGILKRLRGTPIERHTQSFKMRYNPAAPYNILATDCIDFATMQRLSRFARYWELAANSGRFSRTVPVLLGNAPFQRFLRFSDWLFARTGKTHEIALERLYDLLFECLTLEFKEPSDLVTRILYEDYQASGARGKLSFIPDRSRNFLGARSDRKGAAAHPAISR